MRWYSEQAQSQAQLPPRSLVQALEASQPKLQALEAAQPKVQALQQLPAIPAPL